jgi:hypothetical protein
MRAVSAILLAAAAVGVLGSRTAAFEDPHGVGYDGRDWAGMTEQAKLGYIAGFLAGTAAMEALQKQRTNPKLSVDAAVAEIIERHAGAFPFGVNVYKNDLDDYYFYRNNRTVKIYRALINENAQMRRVPAPK